MLALAAVGLFTGLWGGLLRIGLSLPDGDGTIAELHGPLMALGFLGTLIALERAVALGRAWAYVAPVAAGVGVIVALASPAGSLGWALLTLAGVVLVAAHVYVDRIQRSAHNAVMGLGAVYWCVATIAWLAGAQIAEITYLLAGFLVLTIVGERLELSRATNVSSPARLTLLAASGVMVAGLAITLTDQTLGVRVAGLGLLAQALWLARFDIARRTVRMQGLTKYMAAGLLAGYFWLVLAGTLWLATGAGGGPYVRDASLHAVFLGFVMSMVFAHAPIILPSVLRVALPFHRRYYVHLWLLHGSLALRMASGIVVSNNDLWQVGGVLNEVAIVLFLISTAAAVVAAGRAKERRTPRLATST